MKILERITQAVGDAAAYLEEKNRRAAHMNRLRTVIRCEESTAEREYLALGRYFYNNLRDKGNDVTEAHCKELERIEAHLEQMLDQMEQFYQAGDDAIDFLVSEEEKEEITLEDVVYFDHDPESESEPEVPQEEVSAETQADPVSAAGDEIEDENADLPFEG